MPSVPRTPNLSLKRKWEVGASFALVLVVVIVSAVPVRQWQLNRALARAVWGNDLQQMENLLRQGANPNYRDAQYREPMIHHVIAHGARVKMLLRAGANPNVLSTTGELPLIRATASSYPDVVQILLHYGAEVDAVDSFGRTALIAAERSGVSSAIYHSLLEAEARVDTQPPSKAVK
jgi:ankyrin repeat protein